MAEVELTKMSSRGQIVIPQDIRKEMNLKEGETFAVIGSNDTLLLRRVVTPSREEILKRFKAQVGKGRKIVKKLGIRESDVPKLIHKMRGVKE
ncbi:MAG: AbrB/MazE/SpoVT family DNA-binding domain-containing protein [archaeon]